LTKTRHPDLNQEHPDLDQEHPDLDLSKQIAQTKRSALDINKETPSRPEIFAHQTTTQQPWMLCRQAMHHVEQHHLDTDTDKSPP
jgi:hypothetical protein